MRFLVYFAVLLLALAGSARIGLFSLNRLVFGQQHDSDRMKWLLRLIPLALIGLMALWIPLYFRIENGEESRWGVAGGIWMAFSLLIGIYWIAERAWKHRHPRIVAGVHTHEPQIIKLRKAHIPYQFLRRLGAHNDIYDLEITSHDVFVHDLPPAFEGYRVAFMTDTHVASFMRRGFYREAVNQINARNVDLVLFGGDFVSWQRHIPLMSELLITGLESKDGMFAVLGNHDYWAGADEIIAALTAKGVRFVVNRSIPISRDGQFIRLVGIDEIYRGEPDLDAAYEHVDAGNVVLALSHHPDIITTMRGRRADLMLCGHTHGGQIRLPFFGAIVVPSKHEGRYAAGFFRQDRVLMYVSRGLGAIPPIRILCRPEVPIFTLRSALPQGEAVAVYE